MADVLDIEEIVVDGGENMWYGIVDDLSVEIFHLRLDILRQIPGILVIDGTHNDFEFIGGLIVDYIALRLTTVKDALAYKLLDPLDVLYGKESGAYRRNFPVPPEHIRLKVLLNSCLRGEPWKSIAISRIGLPKGHASILSDRVVHC